MYGGFDRWGAFGAFDEYLQEIGPVLDGLLAFVDGSIGYEAGVLLGLYRP